MLKQSIASVVSAALLVAGPDHMTLTASAQALSRSAATAVTVIPAIGASLNSPIPTAVKPALATPLLPEAAKGLRIAVGDGLSPTFSIPAKGSRKPNQARGMDPNAGHEVVVLAPDTRSEEEGEVGQSKAGEGGGRALRQSLVEEIGRWVSRIPQGVAPLASRATLEGLFERSRVSHGTVLAAHSGRLGRETALANADAYYIPPNLRTPEALVAFNVYWRLFRQVEAYRRKRPKGGPIGLRITEANETLRWMVDRLHERQDLFTQRGWRHNAKAMYLLKSRIKSLIHPQGPFLRKLLIVSGRYSNAMTVKSPLSPQKLAAFIYQNRWLKSYLRKDPRKALYLPIHAYRTHLGFSPFSETAGLPVYFLGLPYKRLYIDGDPASEEYEFRHDFAHDREEAEERTLKRKYWGTTSLREKINKRVRINAMVLERIEQIQDEQVRKVTRRLWFYLHHEKYMAVSPEMLVYGEQTLHPFGLRDYLPNPEPDGEDDRFAYRLRRKRGDLGHGLVGPVDDRIIQEAFRIVRRALREALEEVLWRPQLHQPTEVTKPRLSNALQGHPDIHVVKDLRPKT